MCLNINNSIIRNNIHSANFMDFEIVFSQFHKFLSYDGIVLSTPNVLGSTLVLLVQRMLNHFLIMDDSFGLLG